MTISLISGPASAVLTDTFPNPTASAIYALGGVWNGTGWDRERSANAAAGTSGTGVGAAGQMAYDGTNWQVVGAVVGDSGQNASLVAGIRKVVTFSTTSNQAVASTDSSNYRWVSVQVTGIGASAVVNFQGSNDNVNWSQVVLSDNSGTYSSSQGATAGTGIWSGPINYRYFRLNVTGQVSGTTAGTVVFFSIPSQMSSLGVSIGPGGGTIPIIGTTITFSDARTNGSTFLITGAFNHVFNGTTWDRSRSANSAAATTGTGLEGSGPLGIYNSSPPSVSTGNFERLQVDDHASLRTAPNASTSGGATPYKLNSAATTNSTNVKNGAGTVYSITAFNVNASVRYLKLYDKATAPTVGTDTPIQVYALPGNASGAGVTINVPVGMNFANGIGFGITGGITDGDTTSVGANDVLVNLVYK